MQISCVETLTHKVGYLLPYSIGGEISQTRNLGRLKPTTQIANDLFTMVQSTNFTPALVSH